MVNILNWKTGRSVLTRVLKEVGVLLVAIMSFILPYPVNASDSTTITVDFSDELGVMLPHTGTLTNPNYDVPDGRIIPLKVPIMRDDLNSQNWTKDGKNWTAILNWEDSRLQRWKNVYDRYHDLGINYYALLAFCPSWLSVDGNMVRTPNNWPLWKQWVKDNAQFAKDNGMDISYWNVWNEYWNGKDGGMPYSDYNAMYNHSWNAIKEIFPNARMAGPSVKSWDPPAVKNLIDYCSTHGLTLEAPSWHEIWTARRWDMPEHVNEIKAYVTTKPEVGVREYVNEEYGEESLNGLPGKHADGNPGLLAEYIAANDASDFSIAMKAIWDYPHNNLSDLLNGGNGAYLAGVIDGTRTKNWWVMKAYAEMSGTKVRVTQGQDSVSTTAAKDTAAGEAKILIGNSGKKTADITLNLSNQPFADSTIRIDKYKVTSTENDGLVLQSTDSPSSTVNLTVNLSLAVDDVWLIVVKKNASAPGSFCLKTPDDYAVATIAPTLTWTPASGGSTYTLKVSTKKDLSSPVINQSGISGTSYAVSSGLTEGQRYYWSVTAVNGDGSTPAANNMRYEFYTSSNVNVPGRFSLLMPPNGSTGVSTRPSFFWTAASGVASYTLVVDNNSDFSSPEINESGIKVDIEPVHRTNNGDYTPSTSLSTDTVYYYKVIAENANGSRPMVGPVHSFKTRAGDAPGAFSLSSPANGATNVARRATLRWSSSNGGFFYKLEVSTTSDFSNIVLLRDKITINAYTLGPDELAANTTYYWRVTAFTKSLSHSTAASSNGIGFTTENKPCPPLLKTTYPSDGKVKVWFSTVNGATSYTIKYGTSPGIYTKEVAGITSSPYEVKGLADNTTYYFAVVAVNSGTESSIFNEVNATATTPVWLGINLAKGKTASASSQFDANVSAAKANDGDPSTRWNAAAGTGAGEWLEIDFGTNTEFNLTRISPHGDRITGYKIQYWDGTSWLDAYTGGTMGASKKTDVFAAVKGSKARLYVISVQSDGGSTCPTICEFEVVNTGGSKGNKRRR